MISTHGANSLPANMVYLNGKYIKDTYYSRQDGNVGSTFKDFVSLPEGYTKLDYVACKSSSAASVLIITDFLLPDAFSIRMCFNIVSISGQYPYIFSTRYIDEDSSITRLINGSTNDIFFITISSKANDSIVERGRLKSIEFNQDGVNRSYRTSLLSKNRTAYTNTYVDEADSQLTLLSRKSNTQLFTFIVVDKNNRVLFTAIPCVNNGVYGLYDLVGNNFYGSEFLTGV